ncbi:MAG TPA: fuculose phosphate aldolase [Methanoculleus sp.]|nr:fuculose phosphate aldolase [Methanoculleus sp.]
MPQPFFSDIGLRLMQEGLVSGNFGNLSVRAHGGMYITAGGSFLDETTEPVFVPLRGPVPDAASSEYRVHLEAYRASSHTACVHAHPPFAVAASLVFDRIEPVDSEGSLLCPLVPVVEGPPGTQELARAVAGGISSSPVALARGHGTFAFGATLREALILTSAVEHACKILYYLGEFGGFRR